MSSKCACRGEHSQECHQKKRVEKMSLDFIKAKFGDLTIWTELQQTYDEISERRRAEQPKMRKCQVDGCECECPVALEQVQELVESDRRTAEQLQEREECVQSLFEFLSMNPDQELTDDDLSYFSAEQMRQLCDRRIAKKLELQEHSDQAFAERLRKQELDDQAFAASLVLSRS